jgi:hypothetical protein
LSKTALLSLDLSFNDIDDKGVLNLIKSLTYNSAENNESIDPKLETLLLKGVQMKDESGIALS